ncbi:MAG TPA: PQQ-dependent sugar dehydrogenase [Solirubrobacterales bacterium]|nr:PQQ-dependent sugar dehydrogenase [Solirubrobacterales bacterium]
MRRLVPIVVAATLVFSCLGSAAGAATLEPIGKFKQPIFITSDPSNAERLLVAEREGTVNEVVGGVVTPIADLTSIVACCEVERGLLSIAPAPDFDGSGRFYAAYTGKPAAGGAEGDVHVDSFRPGPSVAAPIREPILSVGHATNPNHNGGQLQFGPDGYLYISLGDGGGGGDPLESGQDTEVLLGKILRIDPHPGQSPAYSIPPGNPFVAGPGRDEIWAYGLRNPWRFSFDRANGDMTIADVGQGAREEVDFAPSPAAGIVGGTGADYGWNCREGFIAYANPGPACGSASGFTDPVFDYPHADPGDGSAHGCSIIGGYVVRDPDLTGLYGRYVYSDFCSEEIRSLALPSAAGGRATDDRTEGLSVAGPSSFGEDACGRLYVASTTGAVDRFVGPAGPVCPSAATSGSESPIAPTGPGSGIERKDRPLRLRLQARAAGARLKIVVEAAPCAGQVGDRVQLNRGGEPLGSKPLDDRCLARFFARIKSAATFRALLVGSEEIRSHRLTAVVHSRGVS